MRKNIGTMAGEAVNITEALYLDVKKGVPAKKNASKAKVLKGWKSVKSAYKEVREGEVNGITIFGEITKGSEDNAGR